MYRLLLSGLVLLAAAGVSRAADDKKSNETIPEASATVHDGKVNVIEGPDGTRGEAVAVINPAPLNKAWIAFMVVSLLFMAVIVGQLIWLRGDLERLLTGKR
jgi:hypothetical protein